jgi:DNA polymerase
MRKINKIKRNPLDKIKDCTSCQLHKHRRNVVLGRGSLPADVLYIGEAPGKSEDLLGEAFVGPSGVLLDSLMKDATKETSLPAIPGFYIVNTVLCRPTDEWQGDNRAPSPLEVCQCTRNVMAIVAQVKPKLIICVGKIAEKYYKKEFGLTHSIQHPAYILRVGGKNTPQYKHNFRLLAEAFEELK